MKEKREAKELAEKERKEMIEKQIQKMKDIQKEEEDLKKQQALVE